MNYNQINDYLVDIFNRVLVIEENSLRESQFNDVSLKEMHTLDIIGKTADITPSDIARQLLLTLGTVTTSLNKLEKKGYIIKTRSTSDKRVVYISLTSKGRLLYRLHRRFHKNMVLRIVQDMDETEVLALKHGLIQLHDFLEELV